MKTAGYFISIDLVCDISDLFISEGDVYEFIDYWLCDIIGFLPELSFMKLVSVIESGSGSSGTSNNFFLLSYKKSSSYLFYSSMSFA